MKLIHVIESLNNGAVENWLINTFIQSLDYRPEWQWTFYCILGKPGKLDDYVLKHGGLIIYNPVSISNKIQFLKHLRKSLLKSKADILHVHHDYLSGFYLNASIGVPFKKRILHIHNNDRALPVGNRQIEKMALPFFGWLGLKLSTDIIGISNYTLRNHLDNNMRNDNIRKHVLYYGVDFTKFEKENYLSLREEFNIPKYYKIVLFVGRLNVYKNPLFTLSIIRDLIKQGHRIVGLFVGQGELENELKDKIREYQLEKNIHLMGWREDTASIMKQSDLFIFPRKEPPKEGLGLVVVEAQAAGLPTMISPGIVEDAIVIPELVTRISNSDNLKEWTSVAATLLGTSKPIKSREALNKIKSSVFELQSATHNLISIYEG